MGSYLSSNVETKKTTKNEWQDNNTELFSSEYNYEPVGKKQIYFKHNNMYSDNKEATIQIQKLLHELENKIKNNSIKNTVSISVPLNNKLLNDEHSDTSIFLTSELYDYIAYKNQPQQGGAKDSVDPENDLTSSSSGSSSAETTTTTTSISSTNDKDTKKENKEDPQKMMLNKKTRNQNKERRKHKTQNVINIEPTKESSNESLNESSTAHKNTQSTRGSKITRVNLDPKDALYTSSNTEMNEFNKDIKIRNTYKSKKISSHESTSSDKLENSEDNKHKFNSKYITNSSSNITDSASSDDNTPKHNYKSKMSSNNNIQSSSADSYNNKSSSDNSDNVKIKTKKVNNKNHKSKKNNIINDSSISSINTTDINMINI